MECLCALLLPSEGYYHLDIQRTKFSLQSAYHVTSSYRNNQKEDQEDLQTGCLYSTLTLKR